ncbi:MAG: hypothetical protein EGQ74_07795 [Bacteroides nordii]|nr:hypothetical protein [Bacteroides nordii]
MHKDNANREQNKMNLFIFYAKVQLIFAFLQRLIKIQRCYPFECIKKKEIQLPELHLLLYFLIVNFMLLSFRQG